jgi:hypothetical protein
MQPKKKHQRVTSDVTEWIWMAMDGCDCAWCCRSCCRIEKSAKKMNFKNHFSIVDDASWWWRAAIIAVSEWKKK